MGGVYIPALKQRGFDTEYMGNKSLEVHIEYDVHRDINSWVIADSRELMDKYCKSLIDAHCAAEDWLPGVSAKLAIITDIVPANLFRNVALINPLKLSKTDLKEIPPVFCVNDEVFELCGKEPRVFAVKILKSISNITFLHKSAETNFHLIGLTDAI